MLPITDVKTLIFNTPLRELAPKTAAMHELASTAAHESQGASEVTGAFGSNAVLHPHARHEAGATFASESFADLKARLFAEWHG